MIKPGTLRLLFALLRGVGYEWQPQTPDRLLGFRKDPSPFRPLIQWLGLGLPVAEVDLLSDGMSSSVLHFLLEEQFARPIQIESRSETLLKSAMAISGSGDVFVPHDHWPPDLTRAGGYVHYAAESAWLARALNRDLEGFIGKRVLDLGCSSGALMFELGAVADEVTGLDVSERSIEWGRVTAAALGFKNLRFEVAEVGSQQADDLVASQRWDSAVANPPMVVPAKDALYPHRDGGKLGIELPLLFFNFAHRHLREGGELLTLATNPIVNGKPALFDKLERQKWDTIEKRCLHTHFNQSVARKQGYAEQGIQNIELWFLHLKRL